MKVAVELQPVIKDKSGVGWYTYNLIKELSKKDVMLEGQVFNFLGRKNLNPIINELNFNSEINKLIPYSVYSRIWNYIPIRYNNLFSTKKDIYHFFNFIVPPRIEGKVIVTIYDMVYKLFPNTMASANRRRLDNNLKRSAERANIIVTISNNSKSEIIKNLDISEDKIKIVPCGVYANQYSIDLDDEKKQEIKRRYSLPDKYLLYLGTLEPRKNIETIIKAYSVFASKSKYDIGLVIAGKKGWLFDSIFELVNKFSIEDKVIFTDYVKEEDKPYIYKMSEMFLFPSLYEGFGIPVLEAMAAEIPVITSNTSSLSEVAGDAAILINPMDYTALAEAIYMLLNNTELRNDLIKKGLDQCQKYTWEKSADQMMSVYEDLMR